MGTSPLGQDPFVLVIAQQKQLFTRENDAPGTISLQHVVASRPFSLWYSIFSAVSMAETSL